MYVHVTHALWEALSRAFSMDRTLIGIIWYMFRIAINKLFEWLYSVVLASHHGGLGSIPSRVMSVLGPLV
jgi:hypothetical protein